VGQPCHVAGKRLWQTVADVQDELRGVRSWARGELAVRGRAVAGEREEEQTSERSQQSR